VTEPLTVATLIRVLQTQLEIDPNAIIEIEDEYKFYNIKVIPIRYSPDAHAIVTLRKTNLIYED